MDSLLELLSLDDLSNRIVSTKEYIANVRKYALDMKAFLPLFKENWRLPIKHAKYDGKIAYIQWILRSDELYLSLNVTYYSTGLIKSVEAVSQQLALVEIGDMRNVRTLNGKKFKRKYVHDKAFPVYTVIADRVIEAKPFAISDGGMERFAMRDKILKRFEPCLF